MFDAVLFPHPTPSESQRLLPLSVRHGWLRRNAVSRHGVRLRGAPGAPLQIGCSSANREFAGKSPWDGILAVSRVFDAGCSALRQGCGQPRGSERTGDAGERCRRLTLPELICPACRHMAAHGGTHSVAAIVDIWQLSAPTSERRSNLAPRGPVYRVDGPSGFAQAAENHGRTISERHNRTPQRRVERA
jgi:hypothetical protein